MINFEKTHSSPNSVRIQRDADDPLEFFGCFKPCGGTKSNPILGSRPKGWTLDPAFPVPGSGISCQVIPDLSGVSPEL